MKNSTDSEIAKLQDNLFLIRKAGGWTAEEFGDMIGVTKQTISNLENKKTPMSKTQYIAIRAVLDYEIVERKNDKALTYAVNLFLNSDDLSNDDVKKAQAFVEGATKTGLDTAVIAGGVAALIGIAAVEVIPLFTPAIVEAGSWLAKIMKKK